MRLGHGIFDLDLASLKETLLLSSSSVRCRTTSSSHDVVVVVADVAVVVVENTNSGDTLPTNSELAVYYR